MFEKALAIDLGTSNVSLYVRGHGVVISEPSVAAADGSGAPVAFGREAEALLAEPSGSLHAVRPVRHGTIAEYGVCLRMIRALLKKAMGGNLLKPNIVICVPSRITEVEQKAAFSVGQQAGARHVYLLDAPVAAALGAGLDAGRAAGMMVADIGGGKSDVAVLSLGRIAESETLRTGGGAFNEALRKKLRLEENLLIGEKTAEAVKREIGALLPREDASTVEIQGRDASTGFPRTLALCADLLTEAYREPADRIAEAVVRVAERSARPLREDIETYGLTLTGGGSLLYGMAEYLSEKTGLASHLAENAAVCSIEGAGMVVSRLGNTVKTTRTAGDVRAAL